MDADWIRNPVLTWSLYAEITAWKAGDMTTVGVAEARPTGSRRGERVTLDSRRIRLAVAASSSGRGGRGPTVGTREMVGAPLFVMDDGWMANHPGIRSAAF